jgi:hypothetical protein
MRTFVVLLALLMPALAASGTAWAKSPAEIGKPVCTQYDDAKSATHHGADAIVGTAGTTTAAFAAAAAPPTSGPAPAGQAKGGSASVLHARGTPHWQTLLPGMFR